MRTEKKRQKEKRHTRVLPAEARFKFSFDYSAAYAAAGVDITAGYRAVELMKKHVARTMIPGVTDGIGGFGGLFQLDVSGMARPCLVSGTDGVGTKIRIAQLMDRHDTIGIDCVAMCVNDIICCGARPLFFLDYIAIGRNEPEKVAAIVSGVAEGCVQAGCALTGGETAEHPGLMAPQDYGIHSNGFSLVRKALDVENVDLNEWSGELGRTLGDELLRPTRIYVKPVLAALQAADIHGVSHITGGGFYENIPRCLPRGVTAKIEKSALWIDPIFRIIQRKGNVSEHDMFNTFNMGTGMVLVVAKEDADKAASALNGEGMGARVIGEIVPGGEDRVVLC